MRALRVAPLAWLAALAMLSGCASRTTRGSGAAATWGLPSGSRGSLAVDTAAVASSSQVDLALGYPRPAASYHPLEPALCQCLAARASSWAGALDAECRALAARSAAAGCRADEDPLDYDLLRAAAREARNRSAGDALDAYYRLAQNEARTDLLAASLGDVGAAVAGVDRLRGQGLQLPLDETEFARQQIELRDQQAQVEDAVARLNVDLWQRLGITPDGPLARIWPATDLVVVVAPVDVESAVAEGLGLRPELQLLRRLRASLDSDSLPAARHTLSAANPLLGMAPESTGCGGLLGLCGLLREAAAAKSELPARRRQVNAYSQQREREVEGEIRQAAATVELRLRQIALAKEAQAQWQSRAAHLEGRRQSGGASFAEVSAARLKLRQAEGALLDQVVGWKIALVRLRQAQGLLVAECCP